MKKHLFTLILLLAFLVLCYIFGGDNNPDVIQGTEPKSVSASILAPVRPISQLIKKPNQAEASSVSQSENYQIVETTKKEEATPACQSSSTVIESLKVRESYVRPVLLQIRNQEVKCQKLTNDEKAYMEIKNIYKMREYPSQFIPWWNENTIRELREEGQITKEKEREVQEATLGHVCFDYPNQTTFQALVDVWNKYPCDEAGVYALFEIHLIIFNTKYSSYLSGVCIDGKGKKAFEEDDAKIMKYLYDNYPNTWEAHSARTWDTRDKYGRYSKESMTAQEDIINFEENNDLSNNKYYALFSTDGQSDKIDMEKILANHNKLLSGIYLSRCEEISEEGLAQNGQIPEEAIEMYNKHLAQREKIKTKYPKYASKGTDRLPRCYQLIKEHAPQHYQGDPPIIPFGEPPK